MKKLRVLHCTNATCDSFCVNVSTVKEAKSVIDILSNYDLFEYKNNIKSAYSNETVLEQYNESKNKWEIIIRVRCKNGVK